MNYIQTVAKIRDRSQLTVPQEIRHALGWTEDELLVKIETTYEGFKVAPIPVSHSQNPRKKLSKSQWQKVLQEMEKISQMGKRRVNLTEVLRRDRDSRH